MYHHASGNKWLIAKDLEEACYRLSDDHSQIERPKRQKNAVEKELDACLREEKRQLRKLKALAFPSRKLSAIWRNMKDRCFNPDSKSYRNYGKRGVRVCEAWMEYGNFYKWAMDNGYQEGLTIHRKLKFEDYKPTNCVWLTRSEHSKIPKGPQAPIWARKREKLVGHQGNASS